MMRGRTCHSPAVAIAFHALRSFCVPSVALDVIETAFHSRFESHSLRRMFNNFRTSARGNLRAKMGSGLKLVVGHPLS